MFGSVGFPRQALARERIEDTEDRTNGIAADFVLPDDDTRLLRVSFERQCIIRVLDEMPLSTEQDDTPNEGLVSGYFAYRLEGAAFARLQSQPELQVLFALHSAFT